MMNPLILILFYSLLISSSCCIFVAHSLLNNSSTTTFSCLPHQTSVLLQLKREFPFNKSEISSCYPKMESWKYGSDCCWWDGVTCNMETGDVVSLDLSSSCLGATLRSNSSLFRLLHLQKLNLAFNHFNYSNQIPSELGQLSRLTHLNLSFSWFSGHIPSEISWLTNLMSLDLSYSFGEYGLYVREGELTRLIQNTTNLRLLYLDFVDLSSSPVPQSMGNLSFLTHLCLRGCNLYGEFPQSIFQLPNIQSIDLSVNIHLTSSLPEFHSISNLKSLILEGTNFSGKLPESIGNLKSLNVLNLINTSSSGTVPFSLWNLSELIDVHISLNHFKGRLPSTLGNLPKLTSLQIEDNEFCGELPSSLINLPRLEYLDLSNNNFSGQISSSLINLPRLETLDLRNNNFSGQISSSLIGNLTQLTYLDLSFNSFHGKFPNPMALPYLIEHIDLAYNDLTGSISSNILNFTFLSYLDLSNNLFTGDSGVIPSSLFTLPSLGFLYLDHNQFTNLDMISNSSRLGTLSLSGNKLNGPIPRSISKLKWLEELSLDSTNLSGTVDFGIFSGLSYLGNLDISYNSHLSIANTSMDSTLPQFGMLKLSSCNISEFPGFLKTQHELDRLDLSSNRIGGQIPKWFLNISMETLSNLNLSHNFISGWEEVPLILPWKALMFLDLRSNVLQGPLVVPPNSTWLFLISNNSLIGRIDPLFCKLTNLQVLDAANNRLNGTIPQCMGNLGLVILNLASNNFHGNIPQICSGDESQEGLSTLDLSGNQLDGKVPRSLIKCKEYLRALNLGNNEIIDTFPFWLQDFPHLQVLILSSNKFQGPIWRSDNFSGFAMLHVIDLSHNNFTGNLPSEYFRNWTYMRTGIFPKHNEQISPLVELSKYSMTVTLTLTVLTVTVMNKGQEMEYVNNLRFLISMDLSDNKFYGEIPSTIWDLLFLVVLNLSRNNFSARIPSSLENLKLIESLDLSSNKLCGEIPQQLTKLTFLASLNFSHNQLMGPIPQGGQVSTFENSSFEGNSGLCGLPLSIKCTTTTPPSTFTDDHDSDKSDSVFDFGWKVVAVGYGCGLLVGFVAGHVITSRRPNLISKMFRVRLQRRLR